MIMRMMNCGNAIVMLAYGVYPCENVKGHLGAPETCFNTKLDEELLGEVKVTVTIVGPEGIEPSSQG